MKVLKPFSGVLSSGIDFVDTNWEAAERGGGNLKGFKDFRTENGSSQGQILVLNVLFVPYIRNQR